MSYSASSASSSSKSAANGKTTAKLSASPKPSRKHRLGPQERPVTNHRRHPSTVGAVHWSHSWMRLNRFLAAAGVGSRRYCDQLIAAGRVRINGRPCTDFSAQPSTRDHVKVDGKLVHANQPLHTVMNKPAGFVSTRSDPHARDTIFDLLPSQFRRLFSIGRLDAQSEGLLILTNDGEFAQKLTHPRYKIEKEYEVTLDRRWNPALAAKLLRDIYLNGQRTQIARLVAIGPIRLRVVLRQGINRQ